MQWFSGLATAVPLAGVLIGAALGYVSGRLLETRKQLNLQKGQAYADFLKAVAVAAGGRNANEAMIAAADAKTRACIYGSPNVIRAFCDFEKVGASTQSLNGRAAIAKLVRAMRADVGLTGAVVAESDIHLVLFGLGED